MKMMKIIFSVLCFILVATPTLAHDTDLYMASGEGVEPNILIMFDNSGSMNEEIRTSFYNPSITYDPVVVPQANRDTVYYRVLWGAWLVFKNSITEVECADARTALTTLGHYEGWTNASCSGTYRTLRTGNYRNYLASAGNETIPKLTVAKKVITEFLNSVKGVRVGVMVFNNSEGGHIQSPIKSLTDANRNQLITDINNIVANTWTPLAETLYEAGLYFKGSASYFNSGVVYTSPIEYSCQSNYVIIITDGESTKDKNAILKTVIGDRDGDGREPGGANEIKYDDDGSDYLDDVAKYLYDSDLSSSMENKQNIQTYTIGFTINSDLLQRTAAHGHGRYFTANDVQGLSVAFQNIVDDILSKNTSFVAPIVPVSRMERTTAGDKLYLALFKPKKDKMWSGNIKKFSVAQENNPSAGISVGDLLDTTGAKALDSNGQILSTAHSFWTSSGITDGPDVEKGGLGEVLMKRSSERKIYTYTGTHADLTDSSNAFTLDNNKLTPSLLGLETHDDAGRDKLIRFIHGYDAYDDNFNGNTSEKRDWILGSFVHSRPTIVHYTDKSVIFAGSNDGMLHAFDDSTGEELWGYIPPNLLNKLQALHQDVVESFVDGSPKVYLGTDKKILIFGERRGGDCYTALDITDYNSPKLLWEINSFTTGFSELGQTWSTPQIAKIKYGTGEKWVAFIGGGYDENQDNDPVTLPDSKGRAVYVVDVLTGALVWRYSYAENAAMSYSIPSDIQRVDTDGDGKVDRLYVGDMGGQIWRFDIGDGNPSNWVGKRIFIANAGSKIFYPPDVTLEKDTAFYEMLYFGTGDREHPKEATTINRLYAVKDRNPSTALSEADLVDVTQDLLQDPGTSQAIKDSILASLREKGGWYIKLDLNAGEKSLAPPVVFAKTVYFTTFTPTFGAESDPCFVGEGTARIYILEYMTGNAAFNLDALNDTEGPIVKRSDRSGVIGTAIPSGVVITIINGKAVAYVGVGGGVSTPKLQKNNSLVPLSWRIVF
ncbi:MAG: PilC/PilY family type IV pilus protein [Candidatus Nanoarchaeia archaeon]